MKDKAITKLKETGKYQLFIQVLESKNYELLYTMFGKTIYGLFTPFEYKRKDIKELLEAGNIPAIYNKYMLIDRLPLRNLRTRRKEDIKRLLSEKRYTELYESYGKREFNEHKKEILKNDVEYETGSKLKAKLYKSKYSIGHGLKLACAALLSGIVSLSTFLVSYAAYDSHKSYQYSLEKYGYLISEYDNKINDYAYTVRDLQLDSDLKVVMKVMDDMWSEMGGYGNPEIDAFGMYRLNFIKPGNYGVCRHMADDFCARLNAINPEYNARNLNVYLDTNNGPSLADIDRNVKTSDTVETLSEGESDLLDKSTNLFGNHVVSIFEPIGKDYSLVVDTTNPSIGIVMNGEIYMFSSIDGKGLTFKPIGQLYTAKDAPFSETSFSFIKSLFKNYTKEEIEELNNEWGTEAQNSALDELRQNKRTY